MKTYAAYKFLGGNIKLTGEVTQDETDACIGLLWLEMNGNRILVTDTGDSCATPIEAWDVLNLEAERFVDFGFERFQ